MRRLVRCCLNSLRKAECGGWWDDVLPSCVMGHLVCGRKHLPPACSSAGLVIDKPDRRKFLGAVGSFNSRAAFSASFFNH